MRQSRASATRKAGGGASSSAFPMHRDCLDIVAGNDRKAGTARLKAHLLGLNAHYTGHSLTRSLTHAHSPRSQRRGDVADDALLAPIEIDFAVELIADHSRHHAGAKSLARRRLHVRTAGLNPTHEQPIAGPQVPLDPHATVATESAPYFTALVTSSCKASAIAWAWSGRSIKFGPRSRRAIRRRGYAAQALPPPACANRRRPSAIARATRGHFPALSAGPRLPP